MRRRALSTVKGALSALALLAPLGLAAAAQEGKGWNTTLKWPDGREIQWRATDAPACDGSDIELRLANNSTSAGTAKINSVTFACVKGEATGPARPLGSVAAGSTLAASPIACACAEKGGVVDVKA